MVVLIYPFLGLAALGFLAVLVVHVASLFGTPSLFEHFLKWLGPGVFVVWLPTILVMNRLTREFKQKDIWRAALRGCPEWFRRAVWGILGYGWFGSFALPLLYGGGMNAPGNKARSMSAILLTLYLIATAVLYSATRTEKIDESRRCLNGHLVSPIAKYCEECGAPIRVR